MDPRELTGLSKAAAIEWALAARAGDRCPACGTTKLPGHGLCRQCFTALPHRLRCALNVRVRAQFTRVLSTALALLAARPERGTDA